MCECATTCQFECFAFTANCATKYPDAVFMDVNRTGFLFGGGGGGLGGGGT